MSALNTFYHRLPVVREIERGIIRTEAICSELAALRTLQCLETCERLRHEKSLREGSLCLHRHEHQVCSQNGEDGVIVEIFRRIGEGARSFVEVGIGDGVENNTAFLHSLGWTGAWIDARAPVLVDQPGLRFREAFVTRENIASLFRELAVPTEVDLCSIDVDQNTFYLWEALTDWLPRVIVIEYNASIPAPTEWRVNYDAQRVWDHTLNFGASLKTLELLGRRLGYSLVHCEIIGANAFFVRNDLVGDRFAGPFDSETHHEPPRYALCHRPGHIRSRLDRLPTQST